MCVLNAIANKVDPAKTLLSVIEMFKAIDRSSDVLASVTRPGTRETFGPNNVSIMSDDGHEEEEADRVEANEAEAAEPDV